MKLEVIKIFQKRVVDCFGIHVSERSESSVLIKFCPIGVNCRLR